MDRRYERDRNRDERGHWGGREGRGDGDRNRESGTYRGAYGESERQYGSESSYGRDYGQRDFSDYDENRYLRSGSRSSYGSESDYGGGEYERGSPYYGAMSYRDQPPGPRGGYDPYEPSGERERSRWQRDFGEGRYRESGIEDDRLGEFRRGESWRGREGGGLLSRLFKRGPKGYTRSDDRIREDISERLYNNPYLDSSEVTVVVMSGKVTLDGTVPSRWMRHAIENEADRCAGVRDIDNNIRVQQSDESQTGTSPTSSSASTGTTSGTSRSKLS